MPRAKGGSIPPPRVIVTPGHGGVIATLNANDVLSGRGGRINNHPGNVTFRHVVEDYKREYLDPRTRKLEKAHVAARLVAQIRSTNPPGRFLREDSEHPGCYVEIGDQKAWKKAGQALREDAPDVRKEIDEEMVETKEDVEEVKQTRGAQQQCNYVPSPPRQQKQQQHQHQQQHKAEPLPYAPPLQQSRPHDIPPGIPPSVSYSPNSQPALLNPPVRGGGSGPRPDPPEAPGVSGYRQPPLRYFESGRGALGGRGGRGRGGRGPPPPQHYGYHHHQNYYNHTPPPPGQHHSHQQQHGYPAPGPPPGPQFQQAQYQQQYHHPHQYPQHGSGQHTNQPPNRGHPGYASQLQFVAPQDKRVSKKLSPSTPLPQMIAGPVNAVAAGVHHTVETMNNMANMVTNKVGLGTTRHHHHQTCGNPHTMSTMSKDSRGHDFPPTMSVGTDFTMSDISAFGESRTFTESIRTNASPMVSEVSEPHEDMGVSLQIGAQRHGAPLKQSTGTTSSSSKSKESLTTITTSDLMGSHQSLGLSLGQLGRTRSFPDLLLSTGDLLPPLPAGDSEKDLLDDFNNDGAQGNVEGGNEKEQRSSSGRLLRPPFHRHSSSDSSNPSMASLKLSGFHPVHGRNNTAMSGLNDAMSIMSLDSRKSLKSENSSWMENFKSMQSIGSDMNPWDPSGSGIRTSGHMLYGDDAGSVRSFLSDVSNELNALDLADPLLPPITTENLNNSGDIAMTSRPDP